MSSQLFEKPYEMSTTIRDDESGYASGASSHESLPEIYFTKPHLKFLNQQLQNLEPEGM
jgi:phosphoadenosine phosphosulfate reductase